MEYFGVQEIKSQKNQIQIPLKAETTAKYELIFEEKKLDRVRYNNFFERIECYFTNKDIDNITQATLCRIPTITIHRKFIDGAFRIMWLTISESLLHEVLWSVEGLNIYMFNHGLPKPLVEMIRVMEFKQIQALGVIDLEKESSVSVKFPLETLGITEANCNIWYSSYEIRSKLQISGFSPTFASKMQHPRLSKEKRKQIKKIFKF